MRIVTVDGRNFRNFDYLISALEPGTEVPSEGSGLVVTMLRGDPVTLQGDLADALRLFLLAAASPSTPPGERPDAPAPASAAGARVVVGHRPAPDPRTQTQAPASSDR